MRPPLIRLRTQAPGFRKPAADDSLSLASCMGWCPGCPVYVCRRRGHPFLRSRRAKNSVSAEEKAVVGFIPQASMISCHQPPFQNGSQFVFTAERFYVANKPKIAIFHPLDVLLFGRAFMHSNYAATINNPDCSFFPVRTDSQPTPLPPGQVETLALSKLKASAGAAFGWSTHPGISGKFLCFHDLRLSGKSTKHDLLEGDAGDADGEAVATTATRPLAEEQSAGLGGPPELEAGGCLHRAALLTVRTPCGRMCRSCFARHVEDCLVCMSYFVTNGRREV